MPTREAKIASIRQFLWTHFPDCRVRDVPDLRRDGQVFTVARDRAPMRLLVANAVLDDAGDVPYLDQGLVELLRDMARSGDGVRLTHQRLSILGGQG